MMVSQKVKNATSYTHKLLKSFMCKNPKKRICETIKEYFLPGVSSEDDVIEGAWIMYALFAGHGGSLQ